jgi:hypothetical protein
MMRRQETLKDKQCFVSHSIFRATTSAGDFRGFTVDLRGIKWDLGPSESAVAPAHADTRVTKYQVLAQSNLRRTRQLTHLSR